MEELAFPAWARWRLWWALLLGAFLLAFASIITTFAELVLLLGAFALHFRRTGYAVALEPEGLRYEGRFYPRGALKGVRLDPLLGRLRLDFGGDGLPLPLGLPGWDEVLAHLGVGWREVEGLEDYLLGQRGLVWFLLPEGLGTVLFALGLGLALWWLLFFPHDMVRLRGGGGRYNPLDPEFRKLWEEARG